MELDDVKTIIKKVRKRDGTIVDFDKERITNAIFKAAVEVGGRDRRIAERLSDEVVKILEEKFVDEIPGVEEIQDVVEKVLIERGHARTAKAYILYRKQHEEMRKVKSTFLEVERVVDDYLRQSDWRVRENSNVGYSLSGLLLHIGGSVIANYTLDKIYPMEVADAHINGDFHIHDLGFGIAGYCTRPDAIVAGDYKEIAGYKTNDTCLTISGKTRVQRTFVRRYSGKLVRIKACGILPIDLTPEHPVLVTEGEGLCEWESGKSRWRMEFTPPHWKLPYQLVPKREEKLGDYLVLPRVKGWINIRILDLRKFVKRFTNPKALCEVPLDECTAWLLGIFAAEGSKRDNRVVFCFGKHEKALIERVRSILKHAGVSANIIKQKTSTQVRVGSYVLSRALLEWCGRNAENKRIPEFILYHDDEKIPKAFLDGYLGDGCIENNKHIGPSGKYRGPRIRAQTVSKVLALQLQLLCARLGIFASICCSKGNNSIQGRIVNSKNKYELSLPLNVSKYAKVFKEFIMVPIRSVSKVEYDGLVYNLETENQTYLINNICVHNCAGWSLGKLLAEGFNGVPSKVASRPPAHLDTALLQMTNFVGSLQNEWAGAQAFNSVDVLLAPFVRKDELSYRQVKQAMQTFVFNLNIASRWGGQTPFTNITLDLTVPEDLASQYVTVGGKLGENTYEEYTEEMEMINRALMEVMTEGDMNGRPFTFPIPTYSLTKDFEWDNGVSSALFEMTAKYGLPYFQNFINSGLRPSDVRSMCCHLRLDLAKLRRNVTGGLFGSGDATGSVGVVTINMPRLGYLSRDETEFFERLEYVMELARISLETKRKMVTRNMENGLLPFSKRYLGTLKNHFSTIGLVGMNEACLNLLGCGIASQAGRKFASETLRFMLKRIRRFQRETGNLYNLEATPAEGVSYRLAKIDERKYPDIITAGDGAPYYTNSTCLPVNSELDLIEALRHQEELQTLYTGGCVFHIYLGESLEDGESCKNLVRKVASNTRLPYFTVTPTYTICDDHGFIPGEYPKCPSCGKETEVYSRVVGYYRPVRNFNVGKQEEFRQRITFS